MDKVKNMIDFQLEKWMVTKDITIKQAMERMEEISKKNIFIVNEHKKLIGSLSDGDIRRALLKGFDLDDKIEQAINTNPRYIDRTIANDYKRIRQIMSEHGIESLPVVNINKEIIQVIDWMDVFKEQNSAVYGKKQNKVFLLAGGKGSRLEPFTKIFPKPLIPIGDKPIIEKIMDHFNLYGFGNFIISLNYKADMIKLYFNEPETYHKYNDVKYIVEDIELGTIGSLSLAKDQIKDDFFISNSDIIVEENMNKIFQFHKENKAIMTIVGCIKNSILPYGVLKINDEGTLINLQEKPGFKNIINTGLYVASPQILSFIEAHKRKDITELISDIIKEGYKICVYPVFDYQWFDIGQWNEYERTKKYFEK